MSEPAKDWQVTLIFVLLAVQIAAVGFIIVTDNAQPRRCVAESRCGEVSEVCK